jgi:small-conductance mechanosensitive channel
VLDQPPPEVLFDDFGADALGLRLQYWMHLGGERNGPTVDSDLRFAIDQVLREAGIAVAFPQRDLHLIGPVRVELVNHLPAPAQTTAP